MRPECGPSEMRSFLIQKTFRHMKNFCKRSHREEVHLYRNRNMDYEAKKYYFQFFFMTACQNLVWGEEGLHPFWAQEYTGADLLREKLQESTQWEVSDHLFHIWDSHSSHGEHVSNLIASSHPSAPIPLKNSFSYIPFAGLNHKSEYYDSFMHCQEENSCPTYINISMNYLPISYSGQKSNLIDPIVRTNIVVVTSAGNYGILMFQNKRKHAKQKNIIAVGNCGTDGNPYRDSSYAPEITVCAPSGNILRSYDFAGNPTEFSGTSGAAPQVTGALVAFTAITGYSLNPREAIDVLKKTATPHPHLPTQSNMGAGMLNTWKIGKVAFKLRKHCQENKTCYADSLQSEDTFKFAVDKQSLIKRVSNMEKEGGSREEKENLLKDLRKAALLSSFDGELWSLLANINHKRSLRKQAQYYQSLANRTGKTNRELVYELGENGQYSMLKYLSFSHEEIKEDLAELYFSLLQKEEGIDREVVIELFEFFLDNAEFAFNQQEVFWEMLINHPKIDGEGLGEMGTRIAKNAKNIPAYEKFLQTIIGHSKIDGEGLGDIGQWVARKAIYIPAHEKFLQTIINHSKIDGVGLGRVGGDIAFNAEYIPHYEKLLQSIINHEKLMEKDWVKLAWESPSMQKIFLSMSNFYKRS